MKNSRLKLIREAARKDVSEDEWRKRLEQWIDVTRRMEPRNYTQIFSQTWNVTNCFGQKFKWHTATLR